MKHRLTIALVIWVMVSMLLIGCRDAFHSQEFDPDNATFVPDGINRTLTFHANGGSGTAPARQTTQSGATIQLPGAGGLSRAGHTFGGWNTNSSGTGVNFPGGSSFTVPNQDLTLYARWTRVSN